MLPRADQRNENTPRKPTMRGTGGDGLRKKSDERDELARTSPPVQPRRHLKKCLGQRVGRKICKKLGTRREKPARPPPLTPHDRMRIARLMGSTLVRDERRCVSRNEGSKAAAFVCVFSNAPLCSFGRRSLSVLPQRRWRSGSRSAGKELAPRPTPSPP